LLQLYLIYVNAARVGVFTLNELFPLLPFMRQHLHKFSVIASFLPIFLPVRAYSQLENGWYFISGVMKSGQKSLRHFYCKTIQRTKRRESKKTHASRAGRRQEQRQRTVECRASVQTHLTLPFLLVSVALLTLVPFFFARIQARARESFDSIAWYTYAG